MVKKGPITVVKQIMKVVIQGDQKVSVHLMMYCNCQVHRDVLITLYILC